MGDEWKAIGLVFVVLFVGFALGIMWGIDMEKKYTTIDVLNGVAEYQLQEQKDGTVDWIKVTPYAVNCEPAREFKETD